MRNFQFLSFLELELVTSSMKCSFWTFLVNIPHTFAYVLAKLLPVIICDSRDTMKNPLSVIIMLMASQILSLQNMPLPNSAEIWKQKTKQYLQNKDIFFS